MPFGASMLDGGGVRFALWAPGLDQVVLEHWPADDAASHPMTRDANGWHRLDVAEARAGEGFVYQGEASAFRGGVARGEPSAQLPPTAFVSFLQTHDQVGNRAFGERLHALAGERQERTARGCVCSRISAQSR